MMSALISAFLGARRGSVAIVAALMIIPLLGFTAVAVDGTRAWLVYSRMTAALDVAALAGARNINLEATRRDQEAAAMFWTNLGVREAGWTPGTAIGRGWLSFLDARITVEAPIKVDERTFEVRASAELPTTFARIFAFNNFTMSASAQARRAELGMEIALVLDVTGSMDTNCGTPSNRTAANCGVTPVPRAPGQTITARNNNMDLLRVAAADLVNILFGNAERLDNLFVSLVPYASTVNIGPTRTSWLTTEAQRTLVDDYAPVSWRGCVEARSGNGDRTDDPPSVLPFRPYLHLSTLGLYTVAGARQPGDNDWARKAWNSMTIGGDAITEAYQLWRGNNNVGPNVGCPIAQVRPLTASKTELLNNIQALEPSFRGGTMANLGLQAGWFTLSPRWRNTWLLGAAPAGQTTALPLDYNARNMRKVIVLMTDGANSWYLPNFGFPGSCSGGVNNNSFPTNQDTLPAQAVRPLPCPAANATVTVAPGAPLLNNGDYTGYGRLRDGRLGTTNAAQANTEIDARMTTLCTAVKATGITVYTVVLGASIPAATRTLYENCASGASNYFLVSSPDQLRPAFQQIGTQLANLRLLR